jgi:hypothetical protein
MKETIPMAVGPFSAITFMSTGDTSVSVEAVVEVEPQAVSNVTLNVRANNRAFNFFIIVISPFSDFFLYYTLLGWEVKVCDFWDNWGKFGYNYYIFIWRFDLWIWRSCLGFIYGVGFALFW